MKHYTITSLFSGCGGLDLGFEGDFYFLHNYYPKLFFDVVLANDIYKEACKSYAKFFNRDIIHDSIESLLNRAEYVFRHSDIVMGGFPCQDFSICGKQQGFSNPRGMLYRKMCNVINIVKPKLFLAENVKGLLSIDKGNAFKTMLTEFSSIGYHVVYALLNSINFGVPQKRERIFIIGTKKDLLPPFDFNHIPQSNTKLTVYDAIVNLAEIEEMMRLNHKWPNQKKTKGQGNSITNKNTASPTIRSSTTINFHWSQPRRLSAREAARLQSFPDDFIFYSSMSSAFRQIGNAVPPVMAWHIARGIQNFLDNHI